LPKADCRKPIAKIPIQMKKIYYILTLLLCVYVQSANAQMGVNATGAVPNAAAMLDVRSSDKGFLMPRMTTTQRDAMPAIADGLMIYNTSIAEIQVYRGLAGWKTASRMAVPFVVSGSTAAGGTAIIEATNTGTGEAIRGTGSTAVAGYGSSTGVYGETALGTGIFGRSDSFRGIWGRGITTGDGVYGDATSGKGVYGFNSGTGIAVYGNALTGTGDAVYGEANSGRGGYFKSTSGIGVYATTSSNIAVYADNISASAPVAQFANLSGGTALSVVAQTAIDIAGGIRVSGATSTRAAFKITTNTAGGGNTTANVLTIPNTTLANNINDILIVTHNFSPNSTYLNKAYGVFWHVVNNTWNIYLEDLTAMPNNISFNVLVIKQ
jgi:hypothetical protein